MARVLLYKCCKFGRKICYSSRDIEFSLGDYYSLARPVQRQTALLKRWWWVARSLCLTNNGNTLYLKI